MKKKNLFNIILFIILAIIIIWAVWFAFKPSTENVEVKDSFSQLPGSFYHIDLLTKEYRENSSVENNKGFEYDLDSDGIIDTIKVESKETEFGNEYTLKYGSNIIHENWQGMGAVGIIDLDETDKYLDILVYDDGPSDDPVYYFYRKIDDNIVKLGDLDVTKEFACDGKGRVVAAGRETPWLTQTVFEYYYTIENNKFVSHALDFSYNKDFEYTTSEGFFTTDLKNLENYMDDTTEYADDFKDNLQQKTEKHNIKIIDSNIKFKIIEFVEKENEYSPIDLKVTLSDGTTGYLINPDGRFYIFD